MPARSARRRSFVAVAFVALLIMPQASAATQDDPRQQREEIRSQRSLAAQELDVLRASDAEVHAALDGLALNIAEQESELAEAQDELTTAVQTVRDAEAAEAAKIAAMSGARNTLRSLALAAYAGSTPPGPLDVLLTDDETSSALRLGLAEFQSTQLTTVVDQLRSDAQDLAQLRDAAVAARGEAETRRIGETAQLAQLQEARDAQQVLADELEDRIDRSLAEAESLAALDKQLSEKIAKQEAELAARLKAEQAAREKAAKEAVAKKAAADKAAADKAAADKAKTSTSATTRGSTSSVPSTGSGSTGSATSNSGSASASTSVPSGGSGGAAGSGAVRGSDVVTETARGIVVAAEIADDVAALMDAAKAAGLSLGGAGFRDNSGQIALRRINCGTSDYAIWEMPGSQCSPPTARPGRSMHERGLAIDFTCRGVIVGRNDKCFSWLKDHAGRYGLYNLAGEPWHWSTNGN